MRVLQSVLQNTHRDDLLRRIATLQSAKLLVTNAEVPVAYIMQARGEARALLHWPLQTSGRGRAHPTLPSFSFSKTLEPQKALDSTVWALGVYETNQNAQSVRNLA